MVPESLLQTSTCYRTSNQHRHLTVFATTTVEHNNLALAGSSMPCPSNAALLRASPERPARRLHQPPAQASPCHRQPPSLCSVDLLVAVLLCILYDGASGTYAEWGIHGQASIDLLKLKLMMNLCRQCLWCSRENTVNEDNVMSCKSVNDVEESFKCLCNNGPAACR